MINALNLFKEARELGSTKSYAELQSYINSYDFSANKSIASTKYRVGLWDKVSSVNGISPELLSKDAPDGGEIILIYVDNKLSIIQKHDPSQPGFVAMDDILAHQVAANIIDNFIAQEVEAQAREAILIQMIS